MTVKYDHAKRLAIKSSSLRHRWIPFTGGEFHYVDIGDHPAMALYILCPLEFIQVERGNHAFRARFLIYADTAAPFRRLFLAGGFLDCR